MSNMTFGHERTTLDYRSDTNPGVLVNSGTCRATRERFFGRMNGLRRSRRRAAKSLLRLGQPSFMLGVERPRARQVLDDVAEGLVDGDFLCRTTPFNLARQHLTNFSDDVLITD